ncbi:MAG: hypothetical protein IKF78_07725, partial [Atopobiaceae bacterium]|nr:hypothetical protein [Atopobiaceae bacterium]
METKGDSLTISRKLRGMLVAFLTFCVVFTSVPAQAIEDTVGNAKGASSENVAQNGDEKPTEEKKSPEGDGNEQEATEGDETKPQDELVEGQNPNEQTDKNKDGSDGDPADKPQADAGAAAQA